MNNDRALIQKLNQKLARTGTSSQCRISAAVRGGDVTLSGTLQYEMQRRPLIRAASSVAGVRRVIDQLTIAPKKPRV